MGLTSLRRQLVLGTRRALTWTPARVVGLLRYVLTSYVALGITFWLLPGDQTSGPAALLVLVVVIAVVGTVLRPVLVSLGVVVGPAGLLVVGVVAQAVVLDVALALAPGTTTGNFFDTLVASWIAAAIVALVNWVFDAGSEDAYLAQVLGQAVRVAGRQAGGPGTAGPGLLIVQLDGVAAPLLRQAITSGAVPTISRWLRSGDYVLHRWHTGLPSTTPAGQAVLLHRDVRAVPCFRWFEKGVDGAPGRLMVANRPRDAAEIQRRMSDGRGLLADGGVSISNLFSGDAPTTLLTMSDARLPARSTPGLASFAVARGGLIRSLVLFLGEMVSELQQGRRQRRRDVRPRVRRGGVFVVLRAVTTVLLRDLDVAVVAEHMARGAPVIYVDFVDYDEVAHHAGPSRPESMRTLDGLDRVLDAFEQIAAEVGRRYEIVVLSDHGQSQGATFVQQAGLTLHELVHRLAGASGALTTEDADAAPAEQWGAANVLLTGAARSPSVTGGAARGLLRHRTEGEAGDLVVALGPVRADAAPGRTAPVVAAAGSLAHVYLPDLPGRVLLEQVDASCPGLAEGLAAHPQIGAVVARAAAGLTVLGQGGRRVIRDGVCTGGVGTDPLAGYGPSAAADLEALDRRDHVGDLVVLGRYDLATGDVTAFEELVGSHGGLGGGQTEAVLLHPAHWDDRDDVDTAGATAVPLTGVAVFDLLVDRLRTLGLRPGDDIPATEPDHRRGAPPDPAPEPQPVPQAQPEPEPESEPEPAR